MKKTLLAGALLFALPVLSTFGLDFVKNGKALTGITRVSDEKGAILAVQEITEYTKKVTKADISKLKNGKIIIGTVKSKGIPSSIVKDLKKNPSDEAFFLGEINGKYYIVGQNGVAAYYGGLEFIEQFLGVRWYYPGENGERYKPKKNVKTSGNGKVYAPVFAYRVFNTVSQNGLCKRSRIWTGRNRIQCPGPWSLGDTLGRYRSFHEPRMRLDRALTGGHMTFLTPIPAKKYAKTHPEYFALVDGKRRVTGKMLHHCLSNKDVMQKVYEYIMSCYEKYGEDFTFNIGCVDALANCCECAGCRKMDGGDKLNISRRFHTFAQEVSKKVWAKRPNAKISQWAYWNYRDYPKGLKLDPRTIIYFCATERCYAHALNDPSCIRNVKSLQRLKDWQKVCKNIYIYEYGFAQEHKYQPYSEVLMQDLKLYKEMGLLGRKEEIVYPDASYYYNKNKNPWTNKHIMASRWQFYYLFGKGCWDPSFDFNKKIAEIEKDFYGKLYPAMKKYNDLRRKLWRETNGCAGFPYSDQRTPMVLQKPGAKEELQGYLAEAEKLAGSNAALKRIVEFEKGCLYNYWILPNEKYKKSLSRTASAPMVAKGPRIDGKGNDPVWGRACYITAFYNTFGKKKEPIPAALATSVGILSDKENLYFLLQAKEPNMKDIRAIATDKNKGKIWGDDAFEVIIAPPNNNFKYYQFAVNANGVIQEVEQPGDNMVVQLGATAKAARNKDGFVIELKVPVRKLEGTFGNGAVWKFHVTRNYRVGKSSTHKHFSLDGTAYHATTDYRTITIGSPVIKNGSFEDGVDKKTSRPKFWGYQGHNTKGIKLIKEKGNTAIYIPQSAIISQILYGKFFRPKAPVKVALTFKAKGKGKLLVIDARFDQIINKRGKAANRFLPKKTKIIVDLPLTEKEVIHTVEYVITPLEFSQLRFMAAGKGSYVILDDISARSVE